MGLFKAILLNTPTFLAVLMRLSIEGNILCIIKQGDSDSVCEVIICFVTQFKLSVDLKQLLRVITILGFTLRH